MSETLEAMMALEGGSYPKTKERYQDSLLSAQSLEASLRLVPVPDGASAALVSVRKLFAVPDATTFASHEDFRNHILGYQSIPIQRAVYTPPAADRGQRLIQRNQKKDGAPPSYTSTDPFGDAEKAFGQDALDWTVDKGTKLVKYLTKKPPPRPSSSAAAPTNPFQQMGNQPRPRKPGVTRRLLEGAKGTATDLLRGTGRVLAKTPGFFAGLPDYLFPYGDSDSDDDYTPLPTPNMRLVWLVRAM